MFRKIVVLVHLAVIGAAAMALTGCTTSGAAGDRPSFDTVSDR